MRGAQTNRRGAWGAGECCGGCRGLAGLLFLLDPLGTDQVNSKVLFFVRNSTVIRRK
jgi:hypothetical protein